MNSSQSWHLGVKNSRLSKIACELLQLAKGWSNFIFYRIIIWRLLSDRKIHWSSSDGNIATVNSRGIVRAKKEGTVQITATASNGKSASCKVTILPPKIEPEKITLNYTTLSLKTGESSILTATVLPENATDRTVTWSSNHPDIVSVDNNTGEIKAQAAGNAIVTATASNGISASCTCTVESIAEEDKLSIVLDQNSYSCKSGETLTVTANITLDHKIEKDEKTYILYYAYLNSFHWEEIGGYDIDGSEYFKDRWECTAKITDYKINNNKAKVTLEFPTTGLNTGRRTFVLAIFPYDKYSTGNSLYDCTFRVNII